MLIKRLTIRGKLFSLPLVTALGLLAVLAVAFSATSRMTQDAASALAMQSTVLTTSKHLDLSLTRVEAIVRAAPAEFDAERLSALEAELTTAFESISELFNSGSQEGSDADALQADIAALQAVSLKVFGYSKQFAQAKAVETIENEFAGALSLLQARANDVRFLILNVGFQRGDVLNSRRANIVGSGLQ